MPHGAVPRFTIGSREVIALINLENQYGSIEISQEYFSNLVGKAATECFGVAGMISSRAEGIAAALQGNRNRLDQGVRVRTAGEQLVIDNTGLIWSVARRYFGRGVDPDDLYQLGCVGFLKAVAGFDTQYGTQFSTYAVPKIAGEIRRFLRDDGAVKVSRGLKERAATVKMARQRLTGELGREPTLSEIAEQVGFTVEEIAMAETATSAAESIQRETGEDGFTLEAVLTDGSQEDQLIERIALREAIAKLPERERMVVVLRFFRGLTQEKTAVIVGVSQVQVSRIEKKALTHLRETILE